MAATVPVPVPVPVPWRMWALVPQRVAPARESFTGPPVAPAMDARDVRASATG